MFVTRLTMGVIGQLTAMGGESSPGHAHRPAWSATVGVGGVDEIDACFRREYEGLVRLVWLIAGSQAAAEDAVQDAFVTLHSRWDKVEHPGGYARAIAVNNAMRAARRTALERRLLLRFGTRDDHVEPPDDPLTDALATLSPRQRAAVVLRYYADLQEADIAEALGCAPGTVKSLLSRAKAALRLALTEEKRP